MINLNLIISFIACLSLTTDTSIKKYSEALSLIIKSTEYQSYKINYGGSYENYNVSEEILPFADSAMWFDSKYYEEINHFEKFSTRTEKELLKLNKRKRGNIKIFFTEENDNLFLAEVFYTMKKRSLKSSERPSFGSRYLYMFKNENDKVSLVKVGEVHYN